MIEVVTEALPVIVIMALFLAVTFAVAVAIAITTANRRRSERRVSEFRELLSSFLTTTFDEEQFAALMKGRFFEFMQAYQDLSSHVEMPDEQRLRIESAILSLQGDIKCIVELNSASPFRRSRGALFLGFIPSSAGAAALDLALRKEQIDFVRLRIVHAMLRRRYYQSLPTIFDSVSRSEQEYRDRVAAMLQHGGQEFHRYLPLMKDRREPELCRLFIHIAASHPTDEMQSYLEELIERDDREIAREAFDVLMHNYTERIDPTRYLGSRDPEFVVLAVEALGRFPSEESIETLIPYLAMVSTRESAVAALTEMIRAFPPLLPELVRRFREETDSEVQKGIAEVLATRGEHILERVLREQWLDGTRLLGLLLSTGKATGILSFLNRNNDPDAEAEACQRIGGVIREDPDLREEYSLHAKESVLGALGLERRHLSSEKGERMRENPEARVLAVVLAALFLLPPAFYMASIAVGGTLSGKTLVGEAVSYLVWFQEVFIYYAVALNTVYLILLIAAVTEMHRMSRMKSVRPADFLFRDGVLPAISIIMPAYNEAKTIVESVHGLLNLRYPQYEVIVVNDGSIDNTLQRLISEFELERTGVFIHRDLETRIVRGAYRSRSFPSLLVLDKANGGKADSLNAGINAARYPYYAAIDADSLLENDALLHLAAKTLDSQDPVVAVGGSVLPINGSRVHRGHIDFVGLPRNRPARLQMVEYIRSFMIGRTGWARLKSLLIVSGAFGLFNRAAVVKARGYLTSSERHLKDTVAEDMELVVRLVKDRHERGRPGTVRFAPEAYCWTEVPESLKFLAAQRDRWQRGLIDVLFFHRKMVFNRRFGTAGIFGLSYQFIFEMLGPWVEVQALVFLVIALALSVVPMYIVVLVFTASIGLGVLTSLLAVQLVEWDGVVFSRWDRIRLFLTSISENFGYRQFSSFLRLKGYLSIFGRRSGWGVMRRQGFTGRNET